MTLVHTYANVSTHVNFVKMRSLSRHPTISAEQIQMASQIGEESEALEGAAAGIGQVSYTCRDVNSL